MGLDRLEMLERLQDTPLFDVIIIGGGATGLGALVDSASRGYKTLLLEQSDFAKATSSRSTKLIHGGLRYLKQGNISLVVEALKERGLLCKNAPHLVSALPFLVPSYHWWEGPFYGVGLHLYDLLAGKLGLEKSQSLSFEETLEKIPTLQTEGLRGANLYFDGQFDDARLAITLAITGADLGAVVLNYVKVENFIKENEKICGVKALDIETGRSYLIRTKTVVQATGVFSDHLSKLDDPNASSMITPSQGVHLVLNRSFLPSETALMIPSTEDGRVLFFVPWHNHLLVGTTDTPVESPQLEPVPLKEEVEFLLHHAQRYLTKPPKKEDILSQFAGLRPLIYKSGAKKTSSLSRDHVITISKSGLITIAGGKWTTYRKMGQDAINQAMVVGDLKKTISKTAFLKLHGYEGSSHKIDSWLSYGTDRKIMQEWILEKPIFGNQLHPKLPYLLVELIWAIRFEMARTLEDLLARRTRALFLDAQAALEIAPFAANILANELGKTNEWMKEQVELFKILSKGYLP